MIPNELVDIVEKFESFSDRKIDDLIISFDEINIQTEETKVIGYCHYKGFHKQKFNKIEFQDTPVIILDRATWNRAHPVQKESLLFHELGHCILKKDHDVSLNSDGYPNSLMYPIILPNSLYVEYYPSYMEDLFKKSSDLFFTEQSLLEEMLNNKS